jgi:hypothetical protein
MSTPLTDRSPRRVTLAAAAAVMASAAFASSAPAAEPPAIGHEVISFPSRDFVSAAGYVQGVPARVQVRRRDASGVLRVVSQSTAVMPQDDPSTAGFDGIVEVNHPGGGCWVGVTPDIRPGDKVRVFQREDDPTTDVNDPIFLADDTTSTAAVKIAGRPFIKPGTTNVVRVEGTAQRMDAQGNLLAAQIPLAQLEHRFIAGSANRFVINGRRDLRAPGNGTRAYMTPGSTTDFRWFAEYRLSGTDIQRALNSESRIMWLGRVPANENELTIMEEGPEVFAGPEAPCTAPLEGTTVEVRTPVPPNAALVPAYTSLLPEPIVDHTVEPNVDHTVIAFPSRDFLSAEGYQPGARLSFSVFRNGGPVGQSDEVTVGDDGVAEINHPGGGCWLADTQTPNIRAGDVVRVTDVVTGQAEETTVANVTATRPRSPASGQIVVTGTAVAPNGSRIPLDQLEQRLINPDRFARSGARSLRAPGEGTLQYVGTTGNTWRATYTGLTAADVTKALAAESRILWLGTDPLKENQLTIFEIGEGVQNGPEPPCVAPAETG